MNANHTYIIADHIRSGCFMIADGVLPSPKQRGYVLRRLIRRALLASTKLGIDISNQQYFADLVKSTIQIYDGVYDNLSQNEELIINTFFQEAQKFLKARESGKKEWLKYLNSNKSRNPDALTHFAWDLYQSHGVPFEVSLEEAEIAGLQIDEHQLNNLIEEHQQKSATVSAGQFKSGLGGDTQRTRRLHTATHLLHSVLRSLYGTQVRQIGSAITNEKARFDVTLEEEISDNDILRISQGVQNLIEKDAEVMKEEMTESDARKLGAIGLFGEKYPDVVSIYTITQGNTVFSREFCGGPHVRNTQEIGKFSILHIKSIGQGRKRIEFNVD